MWVQVFLVMILQVCFNSILVTVPLLPAETSAKPRRRIEIWTVIWGCMSLWEIVKGCPITVVKYYGVANQLCTVLFAWPQLWKAPWWKARPDYQLNSTKKVSVNTMNESNWQKQAQDRYGKYSEHWARKNPPHRQLRPKSNIGAVKIKLSSDSVKFVIYKQSDLHFENKLGRQFSQQTVGLPQKLKHTNESIFLV